MRTENLAIVFTDIKGFTSLTSRQSFGCSSRGAARLALSKLAGRAAR